MFTEEERAKFKQRFAAWKAGEKVYEAGKISDSLYYDTMERVAERNNAEWNKERRSEGSPELSVDEEFTRILNDNTYDYRGYYNKYPNGKGNAIDHWTDKFKTVYHPTFSVYSKYSGKKSLYNPEGVLGGRWDGERYIPAWGLKLPKYGGGKKAVAFRRTIADDDDAFYQRMQERQAQLDSPKVLYTRQNNNPVKFDEQGNLVDLVTGETGTMMLPEVRITPKRYDAYHSLYSFNPNNVWKYVLPDDAKKLYNTIDPNYPYGGISAYLDYHLGTNNRKSVMQRDIDTGFSNKDLANIFYNSTEAAFAKYLGLTDEDFLTKSGIKNDKISNYLLPADYTPAKGRTYKNIYKLVHPVGINESSNGDDLIPLLNDYIFAQMVERGKGKSINAISSSLKDAGIPVDTLKINRNYDPIITGTHAFNNITGGDYTIGLGNDANGPYISYYDEYDLNSGVFGQHKLGDIGMSISNPFSLYDRKYFTKDDSTRIVNAYRKFGEKAFDKFGKLRPLQTMKSE